MSRLKIAIVTALMFAPLVFLVCVGAFHLYQTGWSFIAWWPMAACFALAYILAWWWAKARVKLLEAASDDGELPNYWTTRDRQAWTSVLQYVANAPALNPDESADVVRYADDAQKLGLAIARVYKPDAADPFGHLTVPEILTCSELIAADLRDMTVKYIPGSHLIRVNDIKLARKAVDWYETGRNAYWLGSAIMNPLKTSAQFFATKVGLQTPFQNVRNSMLHWFYATYLKELGRYLIELNSGRLKVGAKRYRELLEAHRDPGTVVTEGPNESGQTAGTHSATSAPTSASSPSPSSNSSHPVAEPVSLAIIGQVKAGKSSLVNALFGEQRAQVAVTPETAGATKYRLQSEGLPPLTVIDSAGYGEMGASDRDMAAAIALAKEVDLLVLACHARSAARQADVQFLDGLRTAFDKLPGLKLPQIVLALTHIDLLTPASEWSPPYDWESGTRTKEQSIRNAVAAAREAFGARVDGIVPICTAEGKLFGVKDEFIPKVAGRLVEARGVSLLRALHAESTVGQYSKVGGQILAAGKELLGQFLNQKK
ncbi:MAG: GTPase [Gemmataceae bacterium]